MPRLQGHDRTYMQSRIREEIARCERSGAEFTLIVLEERPTQDGLSVGRRLEEGLRVLQRITRACDVVAYVFEDTLAVLLVDTARAQAKDALLRIQAYIARAGGWSLASYGYPSDGDVIFDLALMKAA